MARNMILDSLEGMIRDFERSNPDGAAKARKCLPYIQCFTCLDTERIIGDRAVLTAFGYDPYMIRSCTCTGRIKDLNTTTHLNHSHNNRPVIYIGSYGTSAVSSKGDVIRVLAEIYERDYQPREEAEAARIKEVKDAEAAHKKRKEEEAARIKEEERLRKKREEEEKAEKAAKKKKDDEKASKKKQQKRDEEEEEEDKKEAEAEPEDEDELNVDDVLDPDYENLSALQKALMDCLVPK
jgi:hypothetical protein